GGQAAGSRAERGATVESAAQTAATAYLRAARAAAVVAARRADSSIAAELVTLAEAQKRAGVSAAIDVTRARTQLVTAQGLTIIARNELDRARIALARALAIDPATPLELADTLTAGLGSADVPGDRQAALAAALAGRPDLRAEVARGAAARQTGSAIRAERLPRLDLEADYGVKGLTVPSAISRRRPGGACGRAGMASRPASGSRARRGVAADGELDPGGAAPAARPGGGLRGERPHDAERHLHAAGRLASDGADPRRLPPRGAD